MLFSSLAGVLGVFGWVEVPRFRLLVFGIEMTALGLGLAILNWGSEHSTYRY